MIISGKKSATIEQVRLVDIHGTRYYDVAYVHDGEEGSLRTARLGPEAVYAGVQAGDKVSVGYLMGVATSLEPRAE